MADNTASLVVALSAQLTKFEKDMRDAGVMADNAVRGIEDKFSKINPQINASFLGNFFANAVTQGIQAATKALTEFYDRFVQLEKQSKILGISKDSLWAFQEVFAAFGASNENTIKSMRALEDLLAGMQRGEKNALTRLLDANATAEALKGVNRETLTLKQVTEVVAKLMADTRRESEKIKVGALAGMTEDVAIAASKAGAALGTLHSQAEKTAPPLQKMADAGKQFEEFIAKAWTVMKGIAGIALQIASSLPKVAYTDEQVRMLAAGTALKPGSETFKGNRTAAERLAEHEAFMRATAPGGGTKLPGAAVGGAAQDSFEKQAESIIKHTATVNADTLAVFQNNAAQAQLRAEFTLLNAARITNKNITDEQVATYQRLRAEGVDPLNALTKANIELTETQIQTFLKVPAAAGAAAAGLNETKDALGKLNSASSQLGSALSTAFADAIVEGKKLNEVMSGLLKTIAKALITSSVGSIFNAPSGGGLSPFASLFKAQQGTDFAPGGLALVGERGPELINLPRGSQVIPNDILRANAGSSGGAIVYSPQIDARGASVEAVMRLAQIIEQDKQTFELRTVNAIQRAKRGRVPGL
jgi:hypothetical protein